MSRRKQVKRCYSCGTLFTWEKGANDANGRFVPDVNGSVRSVEVSTGQIHYCKKRDAIAPETPEVTPEPYVYTPPTPYTPVNPVSPKEPEAMQETPLHDYGVELTPAGLELYKLIEPAIKARFDALVSGQTKLVTHVVDVEVNGRRELIEGCHRQMADLLEMMALRLNVMLTGPAGTGKSYTAELAAKHLGLNFWPMSIGPHTSKSDFFGHTNIMDGKAVWTAVRSAWVNGGVLCLDEIDASSAAISYMNAILANDVFLFPADANDLDAVNGLVLVPKHKDFQVVATANTYGHGPNRVYSGKAQIGADTLDRFIGIDWEYDTDLELATFGKGQSDWVHFVWALRKANEELDFRHVFGSRKIIFGTRMLNAGVSRERVEAKTVWFGVSADSKAKLLAKIGAR